MLNLKFSYELTRRQLVDGATIYYSGSIPQSFNSFSDALSASTWRNHYDSFGCIIVSEYSNEVILVRDHLGVAPLYYWYQPKQTLIVGETIPDVLMHLPHPPHHAENQILNLFSVQSTYSDETIYQGIFRVEPGHTMHFKSNGTLVKKAFWQLERDGELLRYDDEQDYLNHFKALLTESILSATKNQQNIAAEFSAGVDSSAVYCAAAMNNITPKLYMHVGSPGSEALNNYNEHYEKLFINHYHLTDIQRIGAKDFDPIHVFKEYASWFAGPAPYLFFMFANPLHRAVAAGKHRILLSGFGGDQGVSGQIPLNFFLPDLIHQGEYKSAWLEICNHSKTSSLLQKLKYGLKYAQYMHRGLYNLAHSMRESKWLLKNSLLDKANQLPPFIHPYHRRFHRNVREAEWFLLQGPDSHEVRMRIEYSSIVSKKMGFEYRYPLLYPKLLEFILSVPLNQKRHNGCGRYLIRRYLAECMRANIFETYSKKEGMGIVPSTFDLYKQNFYKGCYQHEFQNLPFAHLIQHKNPLVQLRQCIKGFMLKELDFGHK